jgi:hypothetical protein
MEAVSVGTTVIFVAAATAARVWHGEAVRAMGIRVCCGKGGEEKKR